MVRGLVIRQVFIVLDICLALLVVATGGVVAYRMVEPLPEVTPVVPAVAPAGEGSFIPKIGGRQEYDIIAANGLFGEAGRWDPDKTPEEPPPPPVDPDVDLTKLNLRLAGTVALSPDDPFASASIEDLAKRSLPQLFGLGETVVDKVTLAEVHPREVILLNARHSPAKRERLRMDEEEETPDKMARSAPQRRPGNRNSSTERISLDRQEFISDLYTNYADLVTKVKPEMVRDENGKVIGVTAKNISEVPLAGKLGLSDGDVLQTVNNEKIDSEERILEMVQKYRNATSFRIGIIRNGKPRTITYNLQ